MDQKKNYTEPEMKVVNLEAQNLLLECSESQNCGDFGLAPHEQDPIA